MKDYIFGNLIASMHTEMGLSKFQLRKMLGVSDKAVSKWETGSAKPRMNICVHLADLPGISIDVLLETAGYKRANTPDITERPEMPRSQNTKNKTCPVREDRENEKKDRTARPDWDARD